MRHNFKPKPEDNELLSRPVRRRVHLVVQARPANGATEVIIHNISLTGLLLETEAQLRLGEEVIVELPQAGSTVAKVVWGSGNSFGCQFEKTLSSADLNAAELQSYPVRFAIVNEHREGVQGNPIHTQLKCWREKAGLSAAQLARQLNVSKVTVYNWERGKSRPRGANIEALATALRVQPSEFAKDVRKMPRANEPIVAPEDRPPGHGSREQFGSPVAAGLRLAQVIAASKQQIAVQAGTTPDKVAVTVEF